MHNLKITFDLASPVILSRYTTIDSIILARYFNRLRSQNKISGNFIEVEDYLDEISKFILVKNNTLSGSIWYVPKDATVMPYNAMFVKTKDLNHMYKYTGKIQKEDGGGEYKLYHFGLEVLDVKELYFYICGDKEIIKDLLKDIKGIGKKNSAGFGLVKDIKIEKPDDDKSFILRGQASRPLPCKHWNLESDRVMFYRVYPPYYEKTGKVPCYMPPTSLTEYEPVENSRNYISLKEQDYIYPTEFACNSIKASITKSNVEIESFFDEAVEELNDLIKKTGIEKKFWINQDSIPSQDLKLPQKRDNSENRKLLYDFHNKYKLEDRKSLNLYKKKYSELSEYKICAACGKVHNRGVNLKEAFDPNSNNDYAFLSKGDFVCEYCDWSVKSEVQNYLGYLIITKDAHKHIQGKNMDGESDKAKQEVRTQLFSNLDELTPPFYIGIKSTKNQQHIVFKSTVSISNALVPIQYGNDTYVIDMELFNMAIEELKSLIKDTGISKVFWINREIIDGPVFNLPPKNDTEKNRKLLSYFYKKYDRSIRVFLNRAVITDTDEEKKEKKKRKKA